MADKKLMPPRGSISPAEDLVKQYNVDRIFVNDKDRESVSERLQMIGWFDYMLENVEAEYPGCDRLLQEYALINVMSVIEAFMQECIHRCFLFCRNRSEHEDCKECQTCRYFYTEGKDYELRFKKTLDVFRKQGVLTDIDCSILNTCYDIRNEVHIRQFFGRKLEERIYRIHYDNAVSYIDKIAGKCVEEFAPYYDRCRGYVEASVAESAKADNFVEETPQVDMAEWAVMQWIEFVRPLAYTNDRVIRDNLRMACGGMSIEDRTISKPLADYLLDNYFLIVAGLEMDGKFRDAFKDAIVVEMRIDNKMDEEEAVLLREKMRESASKKIHDDFYRIDLDYYEINLSGIDDSIYTAISDRMENSIERLIPYVKELDDEIENLDEEAFYINGFILSNWMFLIRAFIRNPWFTEYVITVIDKVKMLLIR